MPSLPSLPRWRPYKAEMDTLLQIRVVLELRLFRLRVVRLGLEQKVLRLRIC